MFTQLCEELPWAQRLSEVWRMHDPGERSASLALGHGGPAPVRRAIGWYRDHDRLHSGDQVTMAADALTAHQADVAAGGDALLIADTTETTDALNRRIHDQITTERTRTGRDTTTVTAARGHRIGVGDVILTRLNDAAIEVRDRADVTQSLPEAPVRNGQRWQVVKVDDTPDHPRIAARRLGDGAVAVLEGDYLRQQVQLGHAVTVHSAQGVTADSCRAVIGDTTTRNLAYVAMTRGRDTNVVYLYERTIAEADHQHRGDDPTPDGVHVAQRGTPAQAGRMLRQIVGRDELARTAHYTAVDTPAEQLPSQVVDLVAHHQQTVTKRHVAYHKAQRAQRDRTLDRDRGLSRGRSRERDHGYDLSL